MWAYNIFFMSRSASITFALLLAHFLRARGLIIPQLPSLRSANATLGALKGNCNYFPDWIGDGISGADCIWAITELLEDDVVPRRNREFEFYTRGAPRLDFPLPTVITPRSHEYGSCIVHIVMLDMFVPGYLPDGPASVPARSDVATFEEIYEQANAIFHECIKRLISKAGWSYVGEKNSIGVFVIRKGSVLDRSFIRRMIRPNL